MIERIYATIGLAVVQAWIAAEAGSWWGLALLAALLVLGLSTWAVRRRRALPDASPDHGPDLGSDPSPTLRPERDPDIGVTGTTRPLTRLRGCLRPLTTTRAHRGLVLVVEDEPAIADVLRLNLRAAGYGVEVVRDGAAALKATRELRPSALILDIGLPSIDGIEVCRRLRAESDWTPVLFVTARDDEIDRILGLELGADDYVTKPFSPRELVARLGSVLSRARGDASVAEQLRSGAAGGRPQQPLGGASTATRSP